VTNRLPAVSMWAALRRMMALSVAGASLAWPAAAQTSAAVALAPALRMTEEGERASRGVVRSKHEATLSSRTAARIVQMPVREGSAFKRGDLLVAFDCDRTQAEIRAAEATVEAQKKTVETNEELHQFNALGKNDLLISKSLLLKAVAEADALRSQTRDCKVFAPFSGRVVERLAHEHETVTGGQPLLRIIDTDALVLDMIVPSSWLQWLAPGAPFDFVIDETGQTVRCVVDRLMPTVDPVSKTTKITGKFVGQTPGGKGLRGKPVLPGMSGSARFAAADTAVAVVKSATARR